MAVNISLLNSSSTTNINTNFQRVATALQDTIGRSGSLPNQMNADLDMNGNDLLNIKTLDVDDLTVDGVDLTGLVDTATDAAIAAAASALVAQGWAEAAASTVLPDLSIVRAKLSAALSRAVIRDLSEFGAVGDGVTNDNAAITAWLNSSPYLSMDDRTYIDNKRTIPSTVKHIIGKGSGLIKNASSTFTSGIFKNAYVNATAYAIGDMVQFLTTFETIGLGLTTTGLMYRNKTGSTGVAPSNNPAGADNTQWEYVPFDSFWTFSASTDLRLDNVGFSVASITYPQVRTLNLSGCSRVRTTGLRFPEGGGVASYMGNCVDVLHTGTSIYNYAYHGIQAEGSNQKFIKVVGCHVETTGTHTGGGVGTAHGIVFSLGSYCQAIGCTSKNAGVFGFAASGVDMFVLDGISIDSAQEGFNTISGKNGFIRGIAKWDARLSIDFGVSIDGTTGVGAIPAGVTNVHSDVIVERSGVSAFVFTGNVLDCTARVIAKNCNQTDAADEAGVLFSGTGCQRNTAYITMIDEYSPHRMRYGIAEINKGNGSPSNNKLVIDSIAGALTADVIRLGPTSRIFGMKPQTFTPVLSDGSANAIVAGTTNSLIWNYGSNGIDIEFDLYCVPTNIGSATGNVFRATVPIAAAASTGSGAGSQSTTGKMLRLENTATHLLIYNYDSVGQPAINTNRITLHGKYTPTL